MEKRGCIIINQYSITVNDEVFKVFGVDYAMARQTLIDITKKYSMHDTEGYWADIHSSLIK